MIDYADALGIVCDEAKNFHTSVENVPIEQSINRILAEDISSDSNLPPFDNSAMDGYAFRYSDTRSWRLIGEVSAGNYKDFSLSPDETVLITTGSKLPDSADSVVPLEDIEIADGYIHLSESAKIKRGMNVRSCGSDLKKNEIVVHKFSRITPQVVAALATCGKAEVSVLRKLNISILTTGDELIPITEIPSGDKLRVSNLYAVHAACAELHQSAQLLGLVRDDKQKIKELIRNALEKDCDILITTGGVSVGKYDFMNEVFTELKIEIRFWKVNIKPGKPIVFGVYMRGDKKTFVFGLPGNPVSSLVNFQIFIKPAIETILHQKVGNRVPAVLLNDLNKNDNKRHFLRGELVYQNRMWNVSTYSSQSSGNLAELSRANCLIELPENTTGLKQGDIVECITI